MRLRLWWNWQTRYFEVVVGQPVQVQVLLSAPKLLRTLLIGSTSLEAGSLPARLRVPAAHAKVLLLVASLGVLLTTGCARHYNITLTNNHVITTGSKPKQIEPQGHEAAPEAPFKASK